MKKSIVLITFCLFNLLFFEVNAQTSELDSLSSMLEEHTAEDSTRVNLLNALAQKLYRIDFNRASNYAKEANEISTRINFLKGKAKSFNLMGITHNSHEQSLMYYGEALNIYKKLGERREVIKCYINIGISYRYQSNYPKALEYYLQALDAAEDLGDKDLLSGCYNSIGVLYRYQENYSQALDYYNKGLKISEEIGNVSGIANGYNNIGVIYEQQKDYDNALLYYTKALNVYLNNKPLDKYRLSSSYHNIAYVYLSQRRFSEAEEYYKKSLSASQEISKSSMMAYAYQGLANVEFEKGNKKAAYDYGEKAYQLAKETGNVELLKFGAKILASTSYSLGNYKDAYDYYVVYKDMNDSLFNESNIKKVVELEYQYKFEKEKREVELLQQKKDAVRIEQQKRQRLLLFTFISGFILMTVLVLIISRSLIQKRKTNETLALQQEKIKERNAELLDMNRKIISQSAELKSTNQQLAELNATKDKFFSIISHDLRSPFNAILGFSDILMQEHRNVDDDEREELINYVNKSAESAFKLLENLLTWAQSQSGNIDYLPEIFDIGNLTAEAIENLQGQADEKEIAIINEISDYSEIFADKNMISMVLRNLISNALKFTHNGGKVTVNAEIQGREMLVAVSDTGVGIPPEQLPKLFKIKENVSTVGTNDERGTGLGLLLCKEFIEQHGGRIWAESEVGEGTTFFFSIPK